jgi:hypothetical protein
MRAALTQAFPDTGIAEPESSVRSSVPPDFTGGGVVQTFPSLSGSEESTAAASRAVGRMNAAKISDEEMERLFSTRKDLVEKKLAGTISKREGHMLSLIEWELDRIEDARYGEFLDKLEQAALIQEAMASKIDWFASKLDGFIKRERR